jgi:hypothetical protein
VDEFELIWSELRALREDAKQLAVEVAVLKNTRALAWKWGTGAGAAFAAAVAIVHSVWGML